MIYSEIKQNKQQKTETKIRNIELIF